MTTRARTNAPDRYTLYELAAQAPDEEARFLRALHDAPYDRPLTLGEDFSGAGAVARAWMRLFPGARAVCVDKDPEPLARLRDLAADAPIAIRCADVLEARDKVDVLAAFNFAICERTTRGELLSYLRHARARVRPGGLAAFDLYGGMHAFVEGESAKELRSRELGGVRYVWEQRHADPLTGRVVNAMHFYLRDPADRRRTLAMRDAFVYHWRLWSIAELRDAMHEAGFDATEVHAGLGGAVDADGRVYARPVDDPAELDDDYVVYVVARRAPGAKGSRRA